MDTDSDLVSLVLNSELFAAIIGNVVIFGAAIAFVIIIIAAIVRSLLYIAKPNEVLIVSGRSNNSGGGRSRGYRLAKK